MSLGTLISLSNFQRKVTRCFTHPRFIWGMERTVTWIQAIWFNYWAALNFGSTLRTKQFETYPLFISSTKQNNRITLKWLNTHLSAPAVGAAGDLQQVQHRVLHGHREHGHDDDEGTQDGRPQRDVPEPGDLDDVGHGDVHAAGHGDHAGGLVP